uniref:Uncharacterized protein n=1 Tax=Biomphalaria glabrata TaxID=6526 RepID=A0A2C9LPE5_BIOGL
MGALSDCVNSRESHLTDTTDDKEDTTVEIEKPLGGVQRSNHGSRSYGNRSFRSGGNKDSSDAEVTNEGPNNNAKEELAAEVTWEAGSRYLGRPYREPHPNSSHSTRKAYVSREEHPVLERASNHARATSAESYELSRQTRQSTYLHDGYNNLPGDSQEILRPMVDPQKTDQEVTWHDIGNSLDRWLFWIFFLVTNTVTVVILVLFIRNDTELDLSV